MDRLYKILMHVYLKELKHLNLGYPPDEKRINYMIDLINVIDFIKHGNPTANEIYKILEYYG